MIKFGIRSNKQGQSNIIHYAINILFKYTNPTVLEQLK